MTKYLASRLLQAAITLLGISILVFALARLSGDPSELLIPPDASQEEAAAIREAYGLDKPLTTQYWVFLSGAVTGDFGDSLRFGGEPALDVFMQRLPSTLQLAGVAALITAVAGISIGILGAVRFGSLPDKVVTVIALLGQAVPSFWIAILLISFFAVRLGWLPTSGKGGLEHLIMPAIALSWFSMAALTRMTRSSMLDVMDAEYIRLARLKGLPETQVIWKHAFRNALLPVLTLFSLQLIFFVSGSVIIESIFSWPGIGQLAVQAIRSRDYPVVQTIVLLTGAGLVMLNLLVDLLYAVIDPRIRLA